MTKLKKCDILIAFLITFKVAVVANLQRTTDSITEQRSYNLPSINTFNKHSRIEENSTFNSSQQVFPKSRRVFHSGVDVENAEFPVDSDISFHDNENPSHVTEPIHRKETGESTHDVKNEFYENEEINITNNNGELSNVEYEERSSGPILDKINTAESGTALPIFLTEPEDVYVIKNRPGVLKCKAAHALQVGNFE